MVRIKVVILEERKDYYLIDKNDFGGKEVAVRESEREKKET